MIVTEDLDERCEHCGVEITPEVWHRIVMFGRHSLPQCNRKCCSEPQGVIHAEKPANIQTVDATAVITHLRLGRLSACGTPRGEPPHWPAGHYWARMERGYLVSCPKCQRIMKEEHARTKGAR